MAEQTDKEKKLAADLADAKAKLREADAAAKDHGNQLVEMNAKLVAAEAERDEYQTQIAELTAERDGLLAGGSQPAAPSTLSPELRDSVVVVEPGETIATLAERVGCSVDDLVNANASVLDDEARARGADRAVVSDADGQRVDVAVFPGTLLTLPKRR